MSEAAGVVGEWITAERERRGWTKGELAWRARLFPKDVTVYEQGASIPTLEKYARILKAFEDDDGRKPRRRADQVLFEVAEIGLKRRWGQTSFDQQVFDDGGLEAASIQALAL
jgi:transcriptional regulator with XRE-family HTH domain